MGKTLTDEDIKLNVIINGNVAQKELLDLEKATRKLTEENKGLLLQKKLLEKQGKKDSEEWKSLTATIKENTSVINQNKIKMNELQKEIGITGLTMKQLGDRARILKLSLQNAIPGGEAHQRYTAELKEVNARIGELSGKAKTAGFSIGSMADGFNRYAALGASVIAMFTGVILSLQQMIDFNGKLADAQSNVQKTTGMTKDEVDELTKSFGMMKTRTARIDLLGIAETGGRLGIAKAEIADFVHVMDKASVALGDSFEGGPEVVAEKLGKIKGLYEELKNTGVEVAFEAVGSALNDLGAAGTASEGNVAEFVTRVGAMPEAFKPSIAEALGLGAAFEESGIKAEVAAGNYSKVIGIASNNAAGFAQFMKKSKKEVESLINTNPNEFFLQFAKSLKGLSATDLAKVLDSLKLNDNEVKMVLGAASQNVDLFRQKIDLANKSLNQGTSLTTEFDIKNNNLAATLDKLKKSVVGAFSSETLVNWLASAAEWIGRVVGATEDVDGSGQKWRNTLAFIAKMIAIVTAALVTNVAWQKLSAMWTARNTQGTLLHNLALRANAIATGLATAGTQLLSLVQGILTLNITKARQAFAALSATMKTTPWGLIISMIAAVGVAYVAFSEKAEKATKVQKMLSDVHTEATKSITKEKTELELLEKIAKDETLSKEKRLKAIERLNEIIPDYIGTLTLENIKMMEGTNILKKYTDELYKNARAKAAQAKFDELAKQELEVKAKSGKEYRSGTKDFLIKLTGQEDGLEFKTRKEVEQYVLKTFAAQLGVRKDKATGTTLVNKDLWETLVDKYIKAYGIAEKEAELADIKAQMKALEGDVMKAAVEDLDKQPGADVDVSIPGDKDKKEKKYNDSYLKEEEKFSDDLLALRRKTEEAKLALMQDGFEKEMEQERINHKYKILELKNQMVSEQQLNKIDSQISEAEKAGDSPKVKALTNIRKMMLEKNAEINKQIEYEDTMHVLRLRTIAEKGQTEKIKKLQENYEKEKKARQTEFNNQISKIQSFEEAKNLLRDDLSIKQLAKIKTLDAAKKELQDQFNKKEADKEKEHLTYLLAQLEQMVKSFDFAGIEMDLLSPEQKKELQKQIDELKLMISQINAAKAGASSDEENSENKFRTGAGDSDVLGFTTAQWEEAFRNLNDLEGKIRFVSMAVSAMQNLWGSYDAFVTANENAAIKKFEKNSDARKRKLKQQLDNGIINQVQYKKGVEQIDNELAKKKAELEYKQAKRQKAIALTNAIIGTAQAVINGANTQPFFPLGIAMMALAGIAGAMQIATIAKQPLPAPGYEEGLYPEYVKREQDGKVFKSRYGGKTRSGMVNRPTHFLAGENGPEMIIDNKAYSELSPEVKSALLRELRGIKGFEKGYYKDDVFYTGPSKGDSQKEPISNDVLLGLVTQNNALMAETLGVLADLRDNGVVGKFFRHDLKSMKELEQGLKDFNQLKTKNKIT